jgi:hypothetical protein
MTPSSLYSLDCFCAQQDSESVFSWKLVACLALNPRQYVSAANFATRMLHCWAFRRVAVILTSPVREVPARVPPKSIRNSCTGQNAGK